MPKWNSFVLQGFCQNGKNYKKTRILPESQENKNHTRKARNKNHARIARNKNHARIARKQESDKNTRTQESCLARHFLPHQPRFCLHESCQKDKICFFRQESCTEGMTKESCLMFKKNKNLDRSKSRSSTSENNDANRLI